jgi:hypothetical protein
MGAKLQTPVFHDGSSAVHSQRFTKTNATYVLVASRLLGKSWARHAWKGKTKVGRYRHRVGSGNLATYRCGKDLAVPVGVSLFGTPARMGDEGRKGAGAQWEETPKPALAQVPPAHLERGAFRRNPPACRVALHRAFTWWAGWGQIFALRLPESGGISRQMSGVGWSLPLDIVDEGSEEREAEGGRVEITTCKSYRSEMGGENT